MARLRKIALPRTAATTTPGYTNPRGQQVVAATGAPSTMRTGQTVYRLRCDACRGEYGCAGVDIKDRRCPACQDGAAGEPLRERAETLDLFAPFAAGQP